MFEQTIYCKLEQESAQSAPSSRHPRAGARVSETGAWTLPTDSSGSRGCLELETWIRRLIIECDLWATPTSPVVWSVIGSILYQVLDDSDSDSNSSDSDGSDSDDSDSDSDRNDNGRNDSDSDCNDNDSDDSDSDSNDSDSDDSDSDRNDILCT